MREVNFSIPNVNKASVGITTALYDRRALDCTSTLPLINSLNHLAYLTTSSARIRDILTVDGGIERLVCILKQGRSKDMMDMWKWNLAFQCVVNIGVRGTEAVRTRVVEADMVPVIATILDNYIKVIDKCREKAEEAKQRQAEHHGRHRNGINELRASGKSSSFTNRNANAGRFDLEHHRSFRRQAPPPSIDVSAAAFAGFFSSGTAVPYADQAGAPPSSAASTSSTAPSTAVSTPLAAANSVGSTSSNASSTDGSASNTDNDATPTMSQFHITSPSARSTIPSPLPIMPAAVAAPSASSSSSPSSSASSASAPAQSSSSSSSVTLLSDRIPYPSVPRHFHHHHSGHHHHHHLSGVTGPSSASLSAAAAAAAATSAVPSRHTIATPLRAAIQPLSTLVPAASDVRDVTQYAPYGLSRSMMGTSLPASPTTPLPPPQLRSPTVRPTSLLAPSGRSRRRPSIRHQNSTSGPAQADDLNAESVQSDETPDAEMSGTNEIQTAVDIQDIHMEETDSILGGTSIALTTPTVSETQDTGAFNITHRGPLDGSIAPAATATAVPTLGLSPNRPVMVATQQPIMPTASVPRYLLDRQLMPHPQIIATMPREEDVLMSLQLLAYVSKYCNLRSYFQKSHLVPRLKIGKELQLLDGDDHSTTEKLKARLADGEETDDDDDATAEPEEEEYLLPNDVNIFPLVEKFTVRYHSTDMQYWAGVVMRNLCRKDESRDGIRQCAYYQCGKWEEFTRQFAKCRRCRRTKYCSKECQKSAWAFHRHWCVAAQP